MGYTVTSASQLIIDTVETPLMIPLTKKYVAQRINHQTTRLTHTHAYYVNLIVRIFIPVHSLND
jgi:hypothetical protein